MDNRTFTYKLYGDRSERIVAESGTLAAAHGFAESGDLSRAEFALAPLLTRRLTRDELLTPTLVFHPSLLPRHRGRDAIKWALASDESYSGVSWFWANEDLDAGDICEQSVIEVVPGERPRAFYQRAVDEGLRLLGYALGDIYNGILRRRPQRTEAATYERPWTPTGTQILELKEHGLLKKRCSSHSPLASARDVLSSGPQSRRDLKAPL